MLLLLLLLTSRCHFCSALRWLPRCSLIKHAFEALCINEFEGLEFQLDEAGRGMRTGGCRNGLLVCMATLLFLAQTLRWVL
jgi:hypothetical protein